jgi:hypothetical protein
MHGVVFFKSINDSLNPKYKEISSCFKRFSIVSCEIQKLHGEEGGQTDRVQ